MASKSLCDICQRQDKTSAASKFCSDCEDALCAECLNVHNAFKAFATHHVVDITLATYESFAVDKHCSTHFDMILELYCNEHDTLCCRSCMVSDHRTCQKLIPLEVASKNVKTSTLYQDISEDVEQLNKTSKQLTEEKNKTKSVLNQSKDTAQKRVAQFKDALLKRINEMEKNCLSEIDDAFSNLSAHADKDMQNIELRVKRICDITNQFEFINAHGSESQIFRLLHSIKSNMGNMSKDLAEFIPSMRLSTIDVEETDLMSLVKTLGSVKVKDNPHKIDYKPVKSQQAQALQNHRLVLSKLKLEKTVTVPKSENITGICITKDGRLLLCKWNDVVVIVLTNEGDNITKISLSGSPWGIAVVPGSDEAWVTIPYKDYVQIIDTTTLAPTKQVKVSSSGYHGIAFVSDEVALGGYGKVDIISKQGEVIKSLRISCSTIHSVSSRVGMKNIYCCAADSQQLYSINLDGSIVFQYGSSELGGPIGVVQDDSGDLYVTSYNMHNLQKISVNGQLIDIMLKMDDGLNSPYCLTFNSDHTKMFIPNYGDGNLLIVSCIYTSAN